MLLVRGIGQHLPVSSRRKGITVVLCEGCRHHLHPATVEDCQELGCDRGQEVLP